MPTTVPTTVPLSSRRNYRPAFLPPSQHFRWFFQPVQFSLNSREHLEHFCLPAPTGMATASAPACLLSSRYSSWSDDDEEEELLNLSRFCRLRRCKSPTSSSEPLLLLDPPLAPSACLLDPNREPSPDGLLDPPNFPEAPADAPLSSCVLPDPTVPDEALCAPDAPMVVEVMIFLTASGTMRCESNVGSPESGQERSSSHRP